MTGNTSDLSSYSELKEQLEEKLRWVDEQIQAVTVEANNGSKDSKTARYLARVKKATIERELEKKQRGDRYIYRNKMECDDGKSIALCGSLLTSLKQLTYELIENKAQGGDEIAQSAISDFDYLWGGFKDLLFDYCFFKRSIFYKSIDVEDYLEYLYELPEENRLAVCEFVERGDYFDITEIELVKHRLNGMGIILYMMGTLYLELAVKLQDTTEKIFECLDSESNYNKYAEYTPHYTRSGVLYYYKWDLRIHNWHHQRDNGKVKCQKEMLFYYPH